MSSKSLSRRHLLVACAASFFAPSFLIFLIGVFLFPGSALPDVVVSPSPSETIPIVLIELEKMLVSMAIGLGVASLWLYRQPLRKNCRRQGLVVLLGSLASGFASIYAGLRFMFDMSQQLQVMEIEFELLGGRLYFQGFSLALQLSFLCLAAALYFFFRDRRHDRES